VTASDQAECSTWPVPQCGSYIKKPAYIDNTEILNVTANTEVVCIH